MKKINVSSIGDLKLYIKSQFDRVEPGIKFYVQIQQWDRDSSNEFDINIGIYNEANGKEFALFDELHDNMYQLYNNVRKSRSVIPFCRQLASIIDTILDKDRNNNTLILK